MIMGIHGAVAPVVYGGKVRAVMVYLDRQKLQARRPLAARRDEGARRLQRLPADRRRQVRRHRLRHRLATRCSTLVERDGRHPAPHRARQRRLPRATWRRPRTPTSSRPTSSGSTASGRSTSRSSASSGPARCRSSTRSSEPLETMKARLTRAGIDLKLVMDQSVYVRQSIESLVRGGGARGGALLAGDPAVPGRVADDGDRRPDASRSRSWRRSSACTAPGNTINVMTLAGLSLAIGPLVDSAIICLENTHRHLGLGAQPAGGGLPRGERGGDARAGREPLHVPGARAAGPDAGPGRVPVPADGPGRGVRDDRRLPPVADVRPGPLRRLAAGRTATAGRAHARRLRAPQTSTSTAAAGGTARPARSPAGKR